MSAPFTQSRLTREEFKDAPAWIERLIAWLNTLFEQLASYFNKGITFDSNIRCQIKEFSITAGAAAANNTFSFPCTLKVIPRMLIKGSVVQMSGNYVVLTSAVEITWRYDSGSIVVSGISGLTNGEIYEFVVLLI